MENTDKATYKNVLVSIGNIRQWALMRVAVFALCLANTSIAAGQLIFNWIANTYYTEYFILAFMAYWTFQFRNAFPFFLKVNSDARNVKKAMLQEKMLIEQALVKEEHFAYLKERQGRGPFANTQRHLVVNTYHYNIDHLVHEVIDFSSPLDILKLPKSNIIVGLQQNVQSDLNETELDILNKIHQGLADKKIARELKYTPSTIRSYNSRIFKKLGVRTRKEAVTKAIQMGLIE